jgi:hypothetical protein
MLMFCTAEAISWPKFNPPSSVHAHLIPANLCTSVLIGVTCLNLQVLYSELMSPWSASLQSAGNAAGVFMHV